MRLHLHCKPRQAWHSLQSPKVSAIPRRGPATKQRHRYHAQPEKVSHQPSAKESAPVSKAESAASVPVPTADTGSATLPEQNLESGGASSSTAGEEEQGQEQQEGVQDESPHKRPAGYTPFEYVTFGETQLTHEVAIEVISYRTAFLGICTRAMPLHAVVLSAIIAVNAWEFLNQELSISGNCPSGGGVLGVAGASQLRRMV